MRCIINRFKPTSIRASIALSVGFSLSGAAYAAQPNIPITGLPETGAAVASDHAVVTDAAWSVLREGGSAVDAAIAGAFVLSVVMPEAVSIAGAGAALHYQVEGKHITAHVGREVSAAAVKAEWLKRGFPI